MYVAHLWSKTKYNNLDRPINLAAKFTNSHVYFTFVFHHTVLQDGGVHCHGLPIAHLYNFASSIDFSELRFFAVWDALIATSQSSPSRINWMHIARDRGSAHRQIKTKVAIVNGPFPALCSRFALRGNQFVTNSDEHTGAALVILPGIRGGSSILEKVCGQVEPTSAQSIIEWWIVTWSSPLSHGSV